MQEALAERWREGAADAEAEDDSGVPAGVSS